MDTPEGILSLPLAWEQPQSCWEWEPWNSMFLVLVSIYTGTTQYVPLEKWGQHPRSSTRFLRKTLWGKTPSSSHLWSSPPATNSTKHLALFTDLWRCEPDHRVKFPTRMLRELQGAHGSWLWSMLITLAATLPLFPKVWTVYWRHLQSWQCACNRSLIQSSLLLPGVSMYILGC